MARYAHLPAYRQRGIEVAGLFDRDAALAQMVAAEWSVPQVYCSLEAMLGDPTVRLVDIATPPASHADLIDLVCKAGKAALVQKPLCTTRANFERIRSWRARGGRVRLNLTARHVSAFQRVSALLESGAIGTPFFCTIANRDWWDRDVGRWELEQEDFIIHEMSIHHFDLCLRWFGMPARLAARGGINPAQRMAKTNVASVMMDYGDNMLVQIIEDWTLCEFAFSQGHPFEQIVISGDRGVIRANSERVECADLTGRIEVWHHPRPGQKLPNRQLENAWFPDSFGHCAAEMLAALDDANQAAADWDDLERLTALTLTAAEAIHATHWLEAPAAPGAR